MNTAMPCCSGRSAVASLAQPRQTHKAQLPPQSLSQTSRSLQLSALPKQRSHASHSLTPAALSSRQTGLRAQRRRRKQVATQAASSEAVSDADKLKGPPNLLWRVASAMMYIVPWIDTIAIGREIYHNYPISLLVYFLPGPFVKLYYSSQFAPLVVFFLLFLAVVKNNKLPHFVRFNCMQGIMIDIVVMLFNILRAYLPAELRWSAVLQVFDNFSWMICMSTTLYCVYWAIMGKYADIPYVSESVYMQVEASDYA